MNRLSVVKQLTLFVLAIGLWAFIIYIRWFATAGELLFIGASGLDKVVHTAGGAFIAMLMEWRLRRVVLCRLLLSLLAVALGWEMVELLSDSETRFFYENAFNLWLLDSVGDIVAAFLGGYGYWVFGMERKS